MRIEWGLARCCCCHASWQGLSYPVSVFVCVRSNNVQTTLSGQAKLKEREPPSGTTCRLSRPVWQTSGVERETWRGSEEPLGSSLSARGARRLPFLVVHPTPLCPLTPRCILHIVLLIASFAHSPMCSCSRTCSISPQF